MFREVLHNALTNTEGCIGVLIIGMDGIAVEKVWQSEVIETNLDVALAEFTALVRNIKRTNSELELGKLQELTISGESKVFIFHLVSEDYFLAMVLSPKSNFGRGRYELRRAELLLKNELVI